MAEHVYRVLVQGRFDALTDEVRAKLRAEADQHDVLSASFTDEGTLVYTPAIVGFTFRVVVRAEDGPDAEYEAQHAAEERLLAALEEIGCGYRDLKFGVTDMNTMKINRPTRR
jgi:hypothetical protein